MLIRSTLSRSQTRYPAMILLSCGFLGLAACDQPLDFDLRGANGGFSTAEAARQATEKRPKPDNRGVISYPNYQVAVARRGDTLADVAERVGLAAEELATFNGMEVDDTLRRGEVVALPRRVEEPSAETGAAQLGPIISVPGAPDTTVTPLGPAGQTEAGSVDVGTLAGDAIENAAATPPRQNAASNRPGSEPIRHRVERGETAYTIARLYNVPVRNLAEWNGLSSDYAVREGQYLLVPIMRVAPPLAPSRPGDGSAAPTPPSAARPLPQDEVAAQSEAQSEPRGPVADVGTPSAPISRGAMIYPVQGSVIRPYAKGRNDGIDIKASPGTPVKAAASGSVAAITDSVDGVPIIVIRHPDNILTVYANVAEVAVSRGDTVSKGQRIAALRASEADSYIHFEVRRGFDSVDPSSFLD